MNDITISVRNLTKMYKLYKRNTDRFREAVNIFKKQNLYREHFALNDVSFDVRKGETMGIIGENGSGKSTLLKIITGVLNPTSGMVYVDGKVSALLELGAGFNPEYTGIENIYFNGMVMGFTRKEMDAKLDEIIEFADIGEFIHQPVRTYSSGMFVRLAYSVAVSIEPDILIVDEALSVGDAYFQMKSMSKMHELFEKGKTVLFVTHDTTVVKSLCTTAIYLEEGRMVAQGPAKEVVELYETKLREKMSKSSTRGSAEEKSLMLEDIHVSRREHIQISEDFQKKVKPFREGTGEAVVTNIELLNAMGEPAIQLKFNEPVKLRMHILFKSDCEICVGYHIRDNKNIPILGSNTIIEKTGQIIGARGDGLIVEFQTRVPLMEGMYNIMTVLSKTIIHNRTAQFIDVTQNGMIFYVEENKEARIWNKAYIDNAVTLTRTRESVNE